ncbi:palmitoyltransferase ZDHHC18a [Engraulis encrasicolus]|uniref:palmitoyltransferase ZDHHC18a n=1 Tax=Engraulis encrasicolus TaxID=184585 RepID=UPI002FCEE69B
MKNCEYQQIDPRALTSATATPTSTLPLANDKNAQKQRRKWEVFPGRNRFFCDGRIIVSRQSGVLPLTLGLILITSGLFFIFDCPFLVANLTVCIPVIAGVLFVFVVFSLLHTAFTDPGILPRALPDEAADIERQIDNSGSSSYRPPPRTKEILINEQVVKLKYCFTCKMFRPPRTSHCSLCDNCVERFDHHCPWVGNCVGKRNYRFFYSFIVSLSFLTSFIFGCVITHLTLRAQGGNGILNAVQQSPASVVELVVCFFSIWSILGLSGFHTYLVASNLTTNEDIKGSWSSKRGAEDYKNPYTYNNIFTNCCVVLCGPMPPSLIDRRGLVPPDEIPQVISVEQELPPFMVKNDTNMCTQGTKELLETVAHSSIFQGQCSPGSPKTAPLSSSPSQQDTSLLTTPSSSPRGTGSFPPLLPSSISRPLPASPPPLSSPRSGGCSMGRSMTGVTQPCTASDLRSSRSAVSLSISPAASPPSGCSRRSSTSTTTTITRDTQPGTTPTSQRGSLSGEPQPCATHSIPHGGTTSRTPPVSRSRSHSHSSSLSPPTARCAGRAGRREALPCATDDKGFSSRSTLLASNPCCLLGTPAYLHPHGALIFSDSAELHFLPLP